MPVLAPHRGSVEGRVRGATHGSVPLVILILIVIGRRLKMPKVDYDYDQDYEQEQGPAGKREMRPV